MRAEELKGHLDALLLAALEAGPRHGYAVIEALRQDTSGRLDLPTGTIYPALHRLEQAGLITGSWSVVAGRRRRCYRLTGRPQALRAGGRPGGSSPPHQRSHGGRAMAGPSLITGYLDTLSGQLPWPVVEELAGGLEETYRRHLAWAWPPTRRRQLLLPNSGHLS